MPLTVPEGYYGQPYGLESGTRNHYYTQCWYGHYCTIGTIYNCPPGRYGNEYALATADCSGPCTAGYYCTEQSSRSTRHACGADDPRTPEAWHCPEGSGEPNAATYRSCRAAS